MTDCTEQILVFDVGGSHIASSLFNPIRASLGAVENIPAPICGGTEAVFEAFRSLKSILIGTSSAVGDRAPLLGAGISWIQRHTPEMLNDMLATPISRKGGPN